MLDWRGLVRASLGGVGLTPCSDTAGEQDQQRPIGAGEARPFDAAGEDDELLT
jgi:hypothetical protein